MSDYGLVIKNNSSEIQIDSKYRNLSLDESNSNVTISNDNTGTGYYSRISIAPSPLVPLILIRPNTNYFVAVRNYYKSSTNFAGVDIITEANHSTTIDWKSCRENRVASGDSYGLLVYNSDGKLCFDSGKHYFKIHSVHSINLNDPTTATDPDLSYPHQDISHAEISNPYYILSPSSFWFTGEYDGESSEITYRMIGIKKLSSTSVRVGWFNYQEENIEEDIEESKGYNPTMKLVVCDVI